MNIRTYDQVEVLRTVKTVFLTKPSSVTPVYVCYWYIHTYVLTLLSSSQWAFSNDKHNKESPHKDIHTYRSRHKYTYAHMHIHNAHKWYILLRLHNGWHHVYSRVHLYQVRLEQLLHVTETTDGSFTTIIFQPYGVYVSLCVCMST